MITSGRWAVLCAVVLLGTSVVAGCGNQTDSGPSGTPTNAEAAELMVQALNTVASARVRVTTTGGTATIEGTTDWSNVRLLDDGGNLVWLRVGSVDYSPADFCPDDSATSQACTDPDLAGKFYSSGEETGSQDGATMFSDLLQNADLIELSSSGDPVTVEGDTWVLAEDGFALTISAAKPHYPLSVWLRESTSESGESTTTFSDFNQVALFEAPAKGEILRPN